MAVAVVPKELEERLGSDGSRALVQFLNDTFIDERARTLETLQERFLRHVDVKISELRAELKTDIAELKTELKTDIAQLEVKIAQSESRLIRWMFVFWIGQLAVMLPLLIATLMR